MSNSNHQCDQIEMIAARLADQFVKPLFDFRKEKNYFTYIGSLSEILDWSYEFHNMYSCQIEDWESFLVSKENIYHAVNRDEFIVAWGKSRIKQFYAQNENHRRNSVDKQSMAY